MNGLLKINGLLISSEKRTVLIMIHLKSASTRERVNMLSRLILKLPGQTYEHLILGCKNNITIKKIHCRALLSPAEGGGIEVRLSVRSISVLSHTCN